ncbi:D-amino acid dehydrogenase [Parapusillimonas granuli]|uniref:D-amino acid dehydrogenase n=1 Tax=Parapusillimonas granuli TaxID=380911 RepID=A0A853G3F0_9BURK|nr:D-amino acid dehydrogenase [Parapusillimonas granuli]MBB5214289.1 D-amino-acid dehydrogenase [Parapusillimonas granuli]NYT51393.1 D-amino acid dehydrogenase [Parapusillimonas granuli]
MKAIVIGAGVVGVCTAWYMRQSGWDVHVIDGRSGPALETSFANAGQISPSYSAPWANKRAPWLALRWMFDAGAPLLLRPRLDWRQWRWCLQFLTQCSDAAYERNFRRIFALGRYSHQALHEILEQVPIQYARLQKGIVHFYSDAAAFNAARSAEPFYRALGVDRRFVSTEELVSIEPALHSYKDQIAGGSYSNSDETGNAYLFTEALARACVKRGVSFSWDTKVHSLQQEGGMQTGVIVQEAGPSSIPARWRADAIVVAAGVFTPRLLRTVGLDAPIYPGLGYSASFPILDGDRAPWASVVEDKRLALSRLGDRIRVAGTVAIAGYDRSLNTRIAKIRCHALAQRIDAIFPGACDTRSMEDGGDPCYWAGLRPATPSSVPLIGGTKIKGLWINAGHGTLGWTQSAGSAKALATLMTGRDPGIEFPFLAT